MISYNGFNTKVITMPKSEAAANMLGKFVTVDANGNAAVAAKNADFIGLCVADRGAYACVQAQGYVECEYTGTISACGWAHIASNGDNKVAGATAAAGSPLYRVIKLDTDAKTVGFIL